MRTSGCRSSTAQVLLCARDQQERGRTRFFPPNKLPFLERSDYVTNSNDSYWLSNPKHPLHGFARIIGDERTPRSLRTRSGLTMTEKRRPVPTVRASLVSPAS